MKLKGMENMKKTMSNFLIVGVVLILGRGCYEEVIIPDTGVCEPRLTDIDAIVDSLEEVAAEDDSFNAFFEASLVSIARADLVDERESSHERVCKRTCL